MSSPFDDALPSGEQTQPERLLGDYELRGLLGKGGVGEVYRVAEHGLRRTIALKVLREELLEDSDSVARFVEEAQISAQLQHPGIVPVHSLGQLADGRWYFTMKEVQGRTLAEVVAEWHGQGPERRGAWSLRRLMDVFHKACVAVAFAHSRGVLHRDIKPQNIMLGEYGEVLVLDWGLAKLLDAAPRVTRGISTERSDSGAFPTQTGDISGTPAFMSPEQAVGEIERLGFSSDVYSLGGVLFQILTGTTPFSGRTPMHVISSVLTGRREPWPQSRNIPDPLREICDRAMAQEPEERYRDASELAERIADWLDDAHRVEQALQIVARADDKALELSALTDRASRLRSEARLALRQVRPHDPVEVKRPGWTLEDEADALEREAEHLELSWLQDLRGALNLVPTLPEAHRRLADHYWQRHQSAEARRDSRLADSFATLLGAHDVHGTYSAYLRGVGSLTLHTDPPDTRLTLYRYTSKDRRLHPELLRDLGRAPVVDLKLPMGSYLVEARAEGRIPVRYPVFIARQTRWDGIPPGQDSPVPIVLPPEGTLGPDERYVPVGWFVRGGDPLASNGRPRALVWEDAFIIQRFPVTNGDYLVFLNDLLDRGQEEQALRWAQSDSGSAFGHHGVMIVGRDASGRFILTRDAEGDLWLPDWPVTQIDFHCAQAYARWLSERTGQPWALPREDQWEKAARGVDGRVYPWGDFIDPTWCCILTSRPDRPITATVSEFPLDESVYGVRGMAGNVRDWCADLHVRGDLDRAAEPAGAPRAEGEILDRVLRGGCWRYEAPMARIATRNIGREVERMGFLGMRLVRSPPWAS